VIRLSRSPLPPAPWSPLPSAVQWRPDGSAYSPRYQDIYHSGSGALAQACHVFARGCDLPAAWSGRTHHRVLETGLGLASNFLVTWALWRQDPARCGVLHYTGIEAHPPHPQDLLQNATQLAQESVRQTISLGPWPDLQAMAHELAAVMQARPGLQTWDLDDGRVRLTLACGEVQAMLTSLQGQDPGFDSVYLDGFSPRRNPEMWRPAVLEAVTRLCAPAARLSSWCVAGHVRRCLKAAGWQVRREPGLPPKRQRLAASLG